MAPKMLVIHVACGGRIQPRPRAKFVRFELCTTLVDSKSAQYIQAQKVHQRYLCYYRAGDDETWSSLERDDWTQVCMQKLRKLHTAHLFLDDTQPANTKQGLGRGRCLPLSKIEVKPKHAPCCQESDVKIIRERWVKASTCRFFLRKTLLLRGYCKTQLQLKNHAWEYTLELGNRIHLITPNFLSYWSIPRGMITRTWQVDNQPRTLFSSASGCMHYMQNLKRYYTVRVGLPKV